MDRLVLRDNELRSARAALVRERQVRLNAQASLQKLERLQSDRDRDLDEYLIEIDDDTPDSITFESFFLSVDGVPSEPPPRQSDVRELRQRPSAAAITQRAYELWEEAGKPAGQDDHFWFLAEAELQAQDEWRSALGF
jgi:hypothetical protein